MLKICHFILNILNGNEFMTDGQADGRTNGMTYNQYPIKPPLFQIGAIINVTSILKLVSYR